MISVGNRNLSLKMKNDDFNETMIEMILTIILKYCRLMKGDLVIKIYFVKISKLYRHNFKSCIVIILKVSKSAFL